MILIVDIVGILLIFFLGDFFFLVVFFIKYYIVILVLVVFLIYGRYSFLLVSYIGSFGLEIMILVEDIGYLLGWL